MDFRIVQSAITNIISAVENSAVAQVKSLKDHVFSSRITNFPKTQEIKGTVVVGNQKNVEAKLKDVGSILKDIKKAVIEYKAPDSIKVTNFPTPEKFPDFPKEIKVSNFPKQEIVREIEVTNQPVQELENIGEALTEVKKAIDGIKLAPVINVEAPKKETVVVPAPNVVLQEKELDYEKLSKAIASEIPGIDYKKLSEVLVKELSGLVITSGGGGGRNIVKVKETVPTDPNNLNGLLTISNSDMNVDSTKNITKTIDGINYQKTLSYNAAGDLINISKWVSV